MTSVTLPPPTVSARLFRAIQTVAVDALAACSDTELRPALATLVRMSLIASLDGSERCSSGRNAVLQVLSRIELVNNLVALLSIDFHALETDVRKEQQLRAKVGSVAGDSVLISNLTLGPALEFERSDATRRLRLVLSELLAIMGQIKIQTERAEEAAANGGAGPHAAAATSSKIILKQSELFDHIVYLSEVCDVLSIAMAELPGLLSPAEVAEALLRLKFGPTVICHIVTNQPDAFHDVVFHLLRNGDKQDDDGSNKIRQDAILLLCEMNPSEIVTVRNKCIEWCKMPSLALFLTLEAQKREKNSDLISFLSGLLLGSDPLIRSWISFFVRNGQKKRSEDALNAYRKVLLATLGELVTEVRSENSSQEAVVRSCALLRLYTALRGIAGMKLSEQEIALLSDLITCRPPATPAGVQFVSLGLSVLIACNSLISTPQLEKKAVEWIKWLVREEEYFERKSGVSASFGEMLLLMAIHFHSQNLASIIDLVCQTLGMKIAIRTTNMNRMKAIFTQDIFNEQVVASHAVKVPVTRNLSSEISGFLPVHCIHQLLKSRTFSKHKVPIKEWVYNQICVSSTPLHPVLPALIEVYVNSVLVPASNRSVIEQTNEAISEEEIKAVFARPVFEMPAAGALASGSANFFATPGAMPRGRLLKSRDSTPFRMTPSSSPRISAKSEVDVPQSFSIATQILILYYVLLYEQVRLSHMKTILTTQRKVLRYSRALLSQLPIKYLLMTAERDQHRFGGVFPQLLKLCSTQHPHLCLVQDWLEDEARSKDFAMKAGVARKSVSMTEVVEAFALLKECPSKLTIVMEKMLTLPADELWKYSDITLRHIGTIIEPNTPRQVMELYKRLWFELNKVFPRKLWVATINSIVHPDTGNYRGRKNITEEDLILDPLQVLRCDRRIFRAGPILEIVLYVLKACLAASRTHLSQHLQENPIIERNAQHVNNIHQVTNDGEREELKNALIGTQESAAIQILLEAGMPFPGDEDDEHVLSNVKEVQSLICSYLHESFIADPTLAKLVHFQGYPLDLLSVTVPGVPSMHICLDFAPELLSQPDLGKQVFAVNLISHLSIQYALPKSYSIARLAVNALSTLLSVLTLEERNILFPPCLPAFVRLSKAFPPLVEDVASLLLQYGKICVSESCMQGYASPKNFDMSLGNETLDAEGDMDEEDDDDREGSKSRPKGKNDSGIQRISSRKKNKNEMESMLRQLPLGDPLSVRIQAAFNAIIANSLLEKNAF